MASDQPPVQPYSKMERRLVSERELMEYMERIHADLFPDSKVTPAYTRKQFVSGFKAVKKARGE